MCLAALSLGEHERFSFVLATNRDEFFAREAAPMSWWRPEGSDEAILAGRDLAAGGTWLGLTARGRLALVTNVREPGRHVPESSSRGHLVPRWLTTAQLPAPPMQPRNGFNLLTADLHSTPAQWFSNRPELQQRRLGAGTFGLSNAALDTPWPKVQRLKQALAGALARVSSTQDLLDAAFAALRDQAPAPDDELPTTGVPLERERQLSPPFIRIEAPDGSVYGTRCSTVVVVEQRGHEREVTVVERRFDTSAAVMGEQRQSLRLLR